MSAIATFTANHSLNLPEEVAGRFRSTDRFMVWVDGDTIHLKLLVPPALDLVEQASPSDPMSLDEINDIVHQVRRHRRQPQEN